MSSYADLTLGSLRLESSRNGVDPDLIWLFRPSDKHIEHLTYRDFRRLGQYVVEEYVDTFTEENPLTYIDYRCSAEEVRDRLELKGFTLEIAKRRFNSGLANEMRFLESQVRRGTNIDRLRTANEEGLRVLSSFSIEDWLNAVRRIREERLTKDALEFISSQDEELPLLKHMLKSTYNLFGFPEGRHDINAYDFLLFLRLVLEAADRGDQFTYDLTSLLGAGYIDADEDHIALAGREMDTTAVLSQSVIVLTEGTTDRDFLERSFNLLCPHLVGYFHFFEFDLNRQNRVSGGVGPLVNLVRAFAGASVRHRILALFDNDTAAKEALRNLDPSILPGNIVLRHYPDLPLAENYPTVGPTGGTTMNVNGLAGGIELYFGREVLEGEDGQLVPVQWTGYSQGVGAYQGELLKKSAIQQRFRQKLKVCERNPEQLDCYDWTGMRAILDVMRTAFHKLDSDVISAELALSP